MQDFPLHPLPATHLRASPLYGKLRDSELLGNAPS